MPRVPIKLILRVQLPRDVVSTQVGGVASRAGPLLHAVTDSVVAVGGGETCKRANAICSYTQHY